MTRIYPATDSDKAVAMARQTGLVYSIIGNLKHLRYYKEMAGLHEDARRDLGYAQTLIAEILEAQGEETSNRDTE